MCLYNTAHTTHTQYIQDYSEVDPQDYEVFQLSRWCLEVAVKTVQAEPHHCVYLTVSDLKSHRPALRRQTTVESSGSVPATPINEIPTVNIIEGSPAAVAKLQVHVYMCTCMYMYMCSVCT